MCRVGQNRIYTLYTVYDRILGDFPAKNTVYTPYIYGPGQPYRCVLFTWQITASASKPTTQASLVLTVVLSVMLSVVLSVVLSVMLLLVLLCLLLC
jgi:hypothetical protein